MIIGRVIGNVWATKKEKSLDGLKLLVIKPMDHYEDKLLPELIAADCVGAGIGDEVIIVSGSSSRKVLGGENSPVDAMVIGIVDEMEINRDIEI